MLLSHPCSRASTGQGLPLWRWRPLCAPSPAPPAPTAHCAIGSLNHELKDYQPVRYSDRLSNMRTPFWPPMKKVGAAAVPFVCNAGPAPPLHP